MDLILPGKGRHYPEPGEVLKTIMKEHTDLTSLGTFSASLYDTAWVAMVQWPRSNPRHFFPECF
jgi:hypothetical protein